jgi:regulator of RNase E activity RraA
MSSTSTDTTIPAFLFSYTACDISDALLKLKVPHAGYIPDLHLRTSIPASITESPRNLHSLIIGRASTLLFVSKDTPETELIEQCGESNLPSDKHWADVIPGDTILVQKQPEGQRNAVLGGIMAARLRALGVKGVVTHGRVRDLAELESIGLPVFSRGTSTVGQGLASKAWRLNEEIECEGVRVREGDVVVADAGNGVVVIPYEKLEGLEEVLKKSTGADEKVMDAVKGGMSVAEAFKTFR